jgi:ABC-type antimicrobial peptide transport system permease subunit
MSRLGLCLSLLLLAAFSASACTACYGQSDSDMAKGMNMGIYFLLAVLVVVLGSIAGFFVFIIRRAARMAPAVAVHPASQPRL